MEVIRIYKTKDGIVLEHDQKYYRSGTDNWDEYINRDELFESLQRELKDDRVEQLEVGLRLRLLEAMGQV